MGFGVPDPTCLMCEIHALVEKYGVALIHLTMLQSIMAVVGKAGSATGAKMYSACVDLTASWPGQNVWFKIHERSR
jgi:hypothetical protein